MSCKICKKYDMCVADRYDYDPCDDFVSIFDGVDITNPKIFKGAMIRSKQDNDVECGHSDMDELMCALLRKLGYGDGVDVFEQAEKWYA